MTRHEKKPSFAYVTYIAAAPEEVWRALTDGALTRQYWYGRRVDSSWKVGATVTFWYETADGEAISDRGIVLESRAPARLSYTFHVQFVEELRDEHPSRVTFDVAPEGNSARLTLMHDEFDPGSKVLEGCRSGWPAILSSLKSLLETGEPLALASPDAAGDAAA
jgi:uncharacterized protein YndB with AHSA1/START domain